MTVKLGFGPSTISKDGLKDLSVCTWGNTLIATVVVFQFVLFADKNSYWERNERLNIEICKYLLLN